MFTVVCKLINWTLDAKFEYVRALLASTPALLDIGRELKLIAMYCDFVAICLNVPVIVFQLHHNRTGKAPRM